VIISMLSTSQVRPSASSANTERCFRTTPNQRSFKTCRALNLWLPWRESLKRPRSSQSRRRRSLASAPSPSRRPSVGVCKPKPHQCAEKMLYNIDTKENFWISQSFWKLQPNWRRWIQRMINNCDYNFSKIFWSPMKWYSTRPKWVWNLVP